jgi:1-phosphofructokinase
MSTPLITTVTLNPAIDYTIVIPSLTPGTTHRATRTLWEYAGKGFNVSKVLCALGCRSTATGFLYSDDREQAERALASAGITADCVICPGRLRVNPKVFDESTRAVTELNVPGVPTEPGSVEALLAKAASLAEHSAVLVLSGSVPPQCPPAVYRDLIERCQSRCPVVLDASGEALRLAVAARPRVAKPNRAELAALVGRPVLSVADAAAAAKEVARGGVAAVVASLDAEGAIATDGRQTFVARTVEGVDVKGTVGAGDSMVAGYVSGMVAGLGMEQCFARAMAAAAVAVSHSGTGNVTRKDFEEMLTRVVVETFE